LELLARDTTINELPTTGMRVFVHLNGASLPGAFGLCGCRDTAGNGLRIQDGDDIAEAVTVRVRGGETRNVVETSAMNIDR
jgi:hypothetical protein